jgi:hypothetical protein
LSNLGVTLPRRRVISPNGATRYQLAPMDLAESAQSLRHHLALDGRTDPLNEGAAIARLHKASLGLPRAPESAWTRVPKCGAFCLCSERAMVA